MSACSSYIAPPLCLCGIETKVVACLRGEQRKAFLLLPEIQEQDKSVDVTILSGFLMKRREGDGSQYGELKEIYNELQGVLNELKKLMREIRETELKLELKLEQMEKQNNNHISIIRTCIITFVVYVFLNKLLIK